MRATYAHVAHSNCELPLTPHPNPFSPQRDEYLYMTLHFHQVDGKTHVSDGDEPRRVPAGWQIADGSADDVRVCGAHGWQTYLLVFADGKCCYTAACGTASCIGAPRRCCRAKLQTLQLCLTPENRGGDARPLSEAGCARCESRKVDGCAVTEAVLT